MPKKNAKRLHEEMENTEALDSRVVKKIHKLMKLSNEENDILPKRKYFKHSELDDKLLPDSEELEIIEESPFIYDNEGKEYDEEWDKFYQPNANDTDTYCEQLLKNIDDAKSQVADELSEFCGSLPGDLENFSAMEDFEALPPELKDHIQLLKDVMKNFRSGPLPKTIKMLPHLGGWETLLEMLVPLEWSVHSFPRVVKIFSSKGNEQALHFYENYLLPKVLADIEENKRVCVQLFEALIASIFRPTEFLAGIFLPWIRSDMSKTAGVILSHLIRKASMRARFASVALALLCEEEFSIPRSMVIEAILNKKYFMPEAAISRLIEYFISFDRDCSAYYTPERRMPLTWFKSLLTFLEFYREAVSPSEREKLIKLCRRHEHPTITPELRNLLNLISKEPKA